MLILTLKRLPALVLLALIFSPVEAQADPLVLTGSTTASFDSGPFSSMTSLGPLTFTGVSSFGIPEGENVFIFGEPVIVGQLTLNGPLSGIPGGTHQINLQFNFNNAVTPAPFVITGTLELHPEVGGLFIGFPSQATDFTSGDVSGRFTMIADHSFLFVGRTVPVFVAMTLTQRDPPVPTPEPTTMLLLATGLAGAGALVRRRRVK